MSPHLPAASIWLDGAIGAFLGFIGLHPAAMVIVGEGQLGEGPAMGGMLSHLVGPMGWYFTLIGLGAGMLSGYFRGKVKRRSELLAVRTTELERALVENEVLLRILSHDLANSVGGAQTLVEMMVEDTQEGRSESALENLPMVNTSLSQARELIDFSRTLIAIESGKREITLSSHDLGILVDQAITPFRHVAARKAVALDFESVDTRLPCLVEPVTLKSAIVGNLLSNAIKFSARGGKIRVRTRRDGDHVELAVTNLGPGIAAARRKGMASEGGQSTTVGTAGELGTGFGIPLATRFARMMKGELRITSVRVDGTEMLHETIVSVRFPLVDAG